MNSQEIFIEGLKLNGFSGVCDEDCGCSVDDFNPCVEFNIDICKPGYKFNTDCRKCIEHQDFCSGDMDKSYNGYCVVESKELADIMNAGVKL